MMTGASEGMAPAWLATRSAPPASGIFSSPSHSVRNHLRVHGLVEGASQGAGALGAAPLVHVGQPRVLDLLGVGGGDTEGHDGGGPVLLADDLAPTRHRIIVPSGEGAPAEPPWPDIGRQGRAAPIRPSVKIGE